MTSERWVAFSANPSIPPMASLPGLGTMPRKREIGDGRLLRNTSV